MLCILILSQSTALTSHSYWNLPLPWEYCGTQYKWWMFYLNLCKRYLSQKWTIISLSGTLDMYYQSFLPETLSLLSLRSLTLCLCLFIYSSFYLSVYVASKSQFFWIQDPYILSPTPFSYFSSMTANPVDQVFMSRFILDYFYFHISNIACQQVLFFNFTLKINSEFHLFPPLHFILFYFILFFGLIHHYLFWPVFISL